MFYRYQCFDCGRKFSPEMIEQKNQYLCPQCGFSKKNQPLAGVLQILYDYQQISNTVSREKFLSLSPGKFWQFPQLWPLTYSETNSGIQISGISQEILNRLSLNTNPLIKFKSKGKTVLFMDDSRNPTLSYKDRATALVVLKAIQLGISEIAAASTGNAGSSLAGICARMGLKAHLFVPQNIPEAKRIQIQSYGANIYVVDGDYDQAFDLSVEISLRKSWYNRNTAYNPLTIEGKKWGAYDLFLACKGNLPDYIFIPAGDGVIVSGIYKGLWELKQLKWIQQLPHLIAVQSQGSDAIVRYTKTGKFEYQLADTLADSICAGVPRNLPMAARAIKSTQGKAIAVSDEQILAAQKILSTEFGILAEPAAASVLAGYKQLSEQGFMADAATALLWITGNGLKDITSLKKWNAPVERRNYREWVEYFR